jgi:hypothetical protein
MPCDYKKYPKNWKTKIRPDILNRANNCCEECGIENKLVIERGYYNGIEAYQDCFKEEGSIYRSDNSEYITSDYLGSLEKPTGKLITIVLTISHTDHDLENNDYSNLKALCQRCHNRHDIEYRKANRKKNKGVLSLF